MITEIREQDFRKLDIRVWVFNVETRTYEKKRLNTILDDEIENLLNSGYEEDKEDLKMPVTIAVHKDNNKKTWEGGGFYLDKFMNTYTGSRTYQIGWGIDHLYSTRDYYECHDDYWRVRKDETDIIYRVYLDKRYLEKFILKHKIKKENVSEDGNKWIEIYYHLDEATGVWAEHNRVKVVKQKNRIDYTPIK